jgi:superfamily II DNA/RNA helicase
MSTFSEPLQKALSDSGLKALTAVQKSLLPPAFERRDVLAIGPGEEGLLTAMSVILSARVARATGKIVLGLFPETAMAEEVFSRVSKIVDDSANMILLVEEGDFDTQEKALDLGARSLIATPHGLLAHLKIGNISLSSTEFLIIHSLPRLLEEKNFALALTEILRFMPRTRQTIATASAMTGTLNKNLTKILKDPVKVELQDAAPAAKDAPARKTTTRRMPPRQPKTDTPRRPGAGRKNAANPAADVGGVA